MMSWDSRERTQETSLDSDLLVQIHIWYSQVAVTNPMRQLIRLDHSQCTSWPSTETDSFALHHVATLREKSRKKVLVCRGLLFSALWCGLFWCRA